MFISDRGNFKIGEFDYAFKLTEALDRRFPICGTRNIIAIEMLDENRYDYSANIMRSCHHCFYSFYGKNTLPRWKPKGMFQTN